MSNNQQPFLSRYVTMCTSLQWSDIHKSIQLFFFSVVNRGFDYLFVFVLCVFLVVSVPNTITLCPLADLSCDINHNHNVLEEAYQNTRTGCAVNMFIITQWRQKLHHTSVTTNKKCGLTSVNVMSSLSKSAAEARTAQERNEVCSQNCSWRHHLSLSLPPPLSLCLCLSLLH